MDKQRLIDRTIAVVVAYVSHNYIQSSDIPKIIKDVYLALETLHLGPELDVDGMVYPTDTEVAASIRHDGLVSFIDGKSYRSLKRHLTARGLTPDLYRGRYGLPADYPMVSVGYAAIRSRIAKRTKLGHGAA